MGLKDFLKKQGFIEDESGDKIQEPDAHSNETQSAASTVVPTFFPAQPGASSNAATADTGKPVVEPAFVSPLPQPENGKEAFDPSFVKFFEDELVKANLPGPDYFEFRQQLMKTQQKMANKGVVAPEVVLQAVLMSFESQEISNTKLADAARQYKSVLRQKKEDFLKGAAAEKSNQLQKRQNVLQTHTEAIKKIQQQLQQLELQKQQLEQSLNNEKTQLDVNKTLGKEGIEKIERAEHLISLAHDYIQSTIDHDINSLQSV